MALGRVVPPRRAIAAKRAREGGKYKERGAPWRRNCAKSLENLILDAFLVVDYDSDLKNRCSPSHFREIAIDNLSGTVVVLNSAVAL